MHTLKLIRHWTETQCIYTRQRPNAYTSDRDPMHIHQTETQCIYIRQRPNAYTSEVTFNEKTGETESLSLRHDVTA